MLAADLTIKLNVPLGGVDYAFLERIIHQALTEHQVPVVDVEMDGVRVIDSPLGPEPLPAPDAPIGPAGSPMTRPPGARY